MGIGFFISYSIDMPTRINMQGAAYIATKTKKKNYNNKKNGMRY